jgi:hypothetical protein
VTTPPPGHLLPDHVPRHMNRGGLWLRIHRSDGDCILQVEAHGYSMERLRHIVTSEPTLVVAFYDGTTGERHLVVEGRRNASGATETWRIDPRWKGGPGRPFAIHAPFVVGLVAPAEVRPAFMQKSGHLRAGPRDHTYEMGERPSGRRRGGASGGAVVAPARPEDLPSGAAGTGCRRRPGRGGAGGPTRSTTRLARWRPDPIDGPAPVGEAAVSSGVVPRAGAAEDAADVVLAGLGDYTKVAATHLREGCRRMEGALNGQERPAPGTLAACSCTTAPAWAGGSRQRVDTGPVRRRTW